jgi:hypothetical protein
MKPPVVAIGVALCAFTTEAQARSDTVHLAAYDRYRPYADGDWQYSTPRTERQSWRSPKRRPVVGKPGRRHTARGGPRQVGAGAARAGQPTALASRGIVNFARGGTSRACLTPAARGLLAQIEAQFGPVSVVSTCRPGAVIAGTGRPSRHASGNAIDFNAPGGKKAEVVRWLIANHHSGGVMTYASMNHIHVDIGRRFVALGSGGGRVRWRQIAAGRQ